MKTKKEKSEFLARKREQALLGGGRERIEKIHQSGRLTARERIHLLFDEGTFQELGVFVTDAYNNPVAEGTVVFFELTGANADTADITTLVQTDENGVAVATITYPLDAAAVAVGVKVTVGTISEEDTAVVLPTP